MFPQWAEIFSLREFWIYYYSLLLRTGSTREWAKEWSMSASDLTRLDLLRDWINGKCIILPFPNRFELRFRFGPGRQSLSLGSNNRAEEMELGWVDSSFYPDVFRWEELNRLVGCAARQKNRAHSPLHVALLLYNFLGIAESDDHQEIREQLCRDWHRTGIFSRREASRFAKAFFPKRADRVQWIADKKRGWVARNGYSLRNEENEEFNFLSFGRFLRSAGESTSAS